MPTAPRLDILVAIYPGNVEDIRGNLPQILSACKSLSLPWRVTLAYNGNPSRVEEVKKIARSHSNVRVTQVKKPGKGNAVLNNVVQNDADIVAYMDADLATHLDALSHLLAEMEKGADIASGSRYHTKSNISRDPVRLGVSWFYTQVLLRFFLGAHFSDPQCGFKALRRKTLLPILSRVEDAWFFFETELTFRAQQAGLKIVEIPVKWEERTNSSVQLVPTIINFIRQLARIRFTPARETKPGWMEEVHVIHAATFAKPKIPRKK